MASYLTALVINGLYFARPVLGPTVNGLAGTLINKRRKHFIRPEFGVEQFFRRLEERQVRYVILRWFEQLPHVEPGHDLDLLIADEDLERLADLLTYWPVGQAIDLYSVSGAPPFHYAPWFLEASERYAMALLPPHLARRVLEGALLQDGLYRVPNKRDHFLSLAYHAAYLKGPHSGLRSRAEPDLEPAAASHDYAATLAKLGADAGFRLPQSPTHEDLDDLLGQAGWRPPPDTLERMTLWSPWLKARIAERETSAPDGLAAFFIRERAVQDGLKDVLVNGLRLRGFEPLLVKDLDPEASAALAAATRGGNWGAGPYPVSGGPPACVVVALDVMPATMRAENPHGLDNSRIQITKALVRRWVDARLPPASRYNALHSTDNKHQAWEAVRLIAPEDAAAIAARARASTDKFNAQPAGLKDLTRFGNRSRVELIEWRGGLAVRKTFKPHYAAFLQREAEALTALAQSPHVPRLLNAGDSHVVIEHLEDAWEGQVPLPLPLPIVRELAEFMKFCATAGYDPIDLLPRNNIILDRQRGLRVIDFEFCTRRAEGFTAETSYCLSGIRNGFTGDFPFAIDYVFEPYAREWKGYTGLSLRSFLHAPRWRQRLERAINYPGIILKWKLMPWAIEKLRPTRLGRALQSARQRPARGRSTAA